MTPKTRAMGNAVVQIFVFCEIFPPFHLQSLSFRRWQTLKTAERNQPFFKSGHERSVQEGESSLVPRLTFCCGNIPAGCSDVGIPPLLSSKKIRLFRIGIICFLLLIVSHSRTRFRSRDYVFGIFKSRKIETDPIPAFGPYALS